MDIAHKDREIYTIEDGKDIILLLRPEWCRIKTKVFDEGITNKLYGYIDETCQNKDDMILLRIYGNNTDIIINRKQELQTHVKLHKAGFASEVFCTVSNGYFYGFQAGEILSKESVRDPLVAPLIARSMAKMHSDVPYDSKGGPCLFEKLADWLRQVPDYFTTDKFAPLKTVAENKAKINKELLWFQHTCNSYQSKLNLAFCHNDLLLGNIIYNPDKCSISFIDYEYGNLNYQAFDIGNHFNEYAGITDVDFTLYPSKDYQQWWLNIYLEEYHKSKNLGAVSKTDITKLYNETNFFSLGSHIWWGIWAIIQAMNSDIDFDFMDYSRMRFAEYFKQKDKFSDLLQNQ